MEKTVEAHKGAVLGAHWSFDGTALLTCEAKVLILIDYPMITSPPPPPYPRAHTQMVRMVW